MVMVPEPLDVDMVEANDDAPLAAPVEEVNVVVPPVPVEEAILDVPIAVPVEEVLEAAPLAVPVEVVNVVAPLVAVEVANEDALLAAPVGVQHVLVEPIMANLGIVAEHLEPAAVAADFVADHLEPAVAAAGFVAGDFVPADAVLEHIAVNPLHAAVDNDHVLAAADDSAASNNFVVGENFAPVAAMVQVDVAAGNAVGGIEVGSVDGDVTAADLGDSTGREADGLAGDNLKRSWDLAFQEKISTKAFDDGTSNHNAVRRSFISHSPELKEGSQMENASQPLVFSSTAPELPVVSSQTGSHAMVYSAPFEVGSVAVEKMKGRQKKQKQMVVPANRRFTRSQLALDGHRAPPTPGLPAKRRRRAKKSAEVAVAAVAPQGSTGQANPSIPIGTLQHIGHMLDIDEAELTVEKLMADPKDVAPSLSK
jgi:hypothetical protein